MIEIKKKQDCCGCYGCMQACPTKAITMCQDNEGFVYPKVDRLKCINCGKCERVCPVVHPVEVFKESSVYAAYRTDFTKRLKSQSGGLYAVLAESIMQRNGVVCGAAFDENWKLHHCFAENEQELQAQLGSKYVQSEIGDTFIRTREYLNQGKLVLFSGTPCQIQGLKRFIGKEYENLYTVDLICHGVPSPGVWEKYLQEFLHGRELHRFVQKNKQKKNRIEYHLKNGKVLKDAYEDNPYSKAFYKNLFLRPSCHECRFKGVDRCSDITIGDFWGLEKFHPEFTDQYGISAVLVHTAKGNLLLENIKSEIKLVSATSDMLLEQNPCVMASSLPSEKRAVFFDKWKTDGVIQTIDRIYRITTLEKLIVWLNKKLEYMMELKRAVRRRIHF